MVGSDKLYFGYFADAMSGVGNGNYISETSSRSNIHFIGEDPTNYAAWKQKLNSARANNDKVILVVQYVMYPWNADTVVVLPHQDAAKRFATFYNELQSYKDIIVGYYIYDEPFWNNDQSSSKKSISDVYDGLQNASNIIKNLHPEAKTIVTFAYPEIALNIKIPTAIDWVGVNCYFDYGSVCSESAIINMVKYIQQNMTPQQKFVLTLDAYMSKVVSDDVQKNMITRIKFWMNLTKSLPVAAYFPFLFQDQVSQFESLHGAKSHPMVLNYLDQLFNIINSNPDLGHDSIATLAQGISASASPVVQAACTFLEPTCEGSDSVRRDSCGKELDRWKSAPVCSSVKCEGPNYVRRDSTGAIVEVWQNAPLCN